MLSCAAEWFAVGLNYELGRVTSTEVYNAPMKDCGTTEAQLGLGGGLLCPGGDGWRTLQESMTYYDSNEVETLTVNRPCLAERTFDFGYDSQHQLTVASDRSGEYDASFQFSGAGRVLDAYVGDVVGAPQVMGRDVSYTYGDPTTEPVDGHAVKHLLATNGDAVAKYNYDYAGNVISRYDVDGTIAFTYDGADQQRKADTSSGGDELYYYDDAGSRYLAVERTPAGSVVRSRVWFGGTEYWYDGTGSATKRMSNISLGASPVARIDSDSTGDELEFSFHNGLGHMMAAVGTDAEMSTGFVYGPFGEVLEESGDVDTHYRRFNGKEADQLSRLNYYGYRYYDPLSLTWTQADPLYRVAPDIAYDQPRRMSLYAFSLNNPLRYLDPDGHDAMLVGKNQPQSLGLSAQQVRTASTRGGSFTSMSKTKKAAFLVGGSKSIRRSLRGRGDKNAGYFGHADVLKPNLTPDSENSVSSEEFVAAVRGMKSTPENIFIYGCVSDDFAQEVSEALGEQTTVHAYDTMIDVDARAPIKRNGKLDKSKAILVAPPGAIQFRAGNAVKHNSDKNTEESTRDPVEVEDSPSREPREQAR